MSDVHEQLQPALLDRLEVAAADESDASDRGGSYFTFRALRESVRRDLAWLLGSTALQSTRDLSATPNVACSVLNYGLPSLSGRALSTADIEQIAQEIRTAVQRFEPRLRRVHVRPLTTHVDVTTGVLEFSLEGELWAQPRPEFLVLRTTVDVATGTAEVGDHQGA